MFGQPLQPMPSDLGATRRCLNDMLHHIALAQGFIAGMDYAFFKDDQRTVYAVTRCLEIISEASRRSTADYRVPIWPLHRGQDSHRRF